MDPGGCAVFYLSCLHLFLWEKVDSTAAVFYYTLLYPVFAVRGVIMELTVEMLANDGHDIAYPYLLLLIFAA